MGDLPYISSEQGGLIIRTELIYDYHVLYLYNNFKLKRGIDCCSYSLAITTPALNTTLWLLVWQEAFDLHGTDRKQTRTQP